MFQISFKSIYIKVQAYLFLYQLSRLSSLRVAFQSPFHVYPYQGLSGIFHNSEQQNLFLRSRSQHYA